MVTAVVAAAVVAAVLVVAVLLARLASARSQRRFEAVVGHSTCTWRRFAESAACRRRSDDARERGLGDLGLTLDLRELLQRLAEEAATRTGAQAATVRVRGPGDMPAIASFGTGDGAALLEATLGLPTRGRSER